MYLEKHNGVRSLHEPGAIVLISCYELGHQPLGLVFPDAHLRDAGFCPALIDIDVEPFDEQILRGVRLVGISVPMHTALKLGIGVAERIRQISPDSHIAFYGLYAALNEDYLLSTVADSCFGAEFEADLVELARLLDGATDTNERAGTERRARKHSPPRLQDKRPVLARRDGVPSLDHYTKLAMDDRYHPVGYVVTTRGCKHRCLHCPIPPIYKGRFYALPGEVVLNDIRQLVLAGAKHITFGDPDFLNGPQHARRLVRAMRQEFPKLTFDFTAKVEHLVNHKSLVRELKELGCVFVVSAFESLSVRTLSALHKRHTERDILDTLRFFKAIDLALKPTFV
ncbi:MAG: radical SAM protein, partial [Candidatus Krumholzibacteria bacterium]|nr:radical SAM protein [Candidatus Krumholzibacteria bacterium]